MTRKFNWLLALLVVTLLVAACGPDMVTPTPGTMPGEEADTEPTAAAGESPEAPSAGDLPVDDDDWRVLGSADAPVTVIEYSDFQ